mgnify:CR=1 FL=1
MADRNQRIRTVIDKNLRDIITLEVKNPKIGFVCISEIIVSADYSHAKVFLNFLGSKNPKESMKELNKARGFIRSSLAKKIDIRRTPDVEFYFDDSYQKGESIDKAIEKENELLKEITSRIKK